jgi:hypothetical protein
MGQVSRPDHFLGLAPEIHLEQIPVVLEKNISQRWAQP